MSIYATIIENGVRADKQMNNEPNADANDCSPPSICRRHHNQRGIVRTGTTNLTAEAPTDNFDKCAKPINEEQSP